MEKFFHNLEKLKFAYDFTEKLVMVVCKLLLIADIAFAVYTVLARYIKVIPGAAWTEEVILTLMCYMAVLSAALAIRKGTHIRMTVFDRYLPKTLLQILDLLADVAVLVLGVVMLQVGWKYATGLGSFAKYVSMPKVSKIYMYMPVPIAGIAMIIFELEAIFNGLKAMLVKEEV